ncbi:MAG TPA: hypothetical protein VIV65_01800 [Gemmatimonadaceae bacterium]
MRRVFSSIAVSALVLAPAIVRAQVQQADANRAVAGGGVMVPGWQARADGNASITDAKFTKEGDAFHVTTGPAIAYWNPSNTASGNYTVKATFNEPKFQNLNDHPHPYGVFIGGNDMGTDAQTYMYCAAYGNGTFITRGFGPAPFQIGRRAPDSAVAKAAGVGQPVKQEVALSVKGDKVECSINGKVVASIDKAQIVGPGKLKSLDGVYGIRFAHNTEATVTGLTMTKQ